MPQKFGLMLLFISVTIQASVLHAAEPDQARWDRERKQINKQIELMTEKLGLSAAQQTSVRVALQTKSDHMDAWRKEIVEKRKAIDQAAEESIQAALTPEQRSKYDEMKRSMRGRGGPGEGMPDDEGFGPGPRGKGGMRGGGGGGMGGRPPF